MKSVDFVKSFNPIKEAIKNNNIVYIKPHHHIENLRLFYDEMTEELGETLLVGEDQSGAKTGNKWIEIRYDKEVSNAYRYSKGPQPLHTDESYVRDPADVMFFYCVNQAPSGGETIFVELEMLIGFLSARSPLLLKKLLTTEVGYKKVREERRRPIIMFKDGEHSINYNYFCVDPDDTEVAKSLNKEFHNFLQTSVVGTDLVQEVMLRPGESVAWWDHKVLHGRNSFSADKTDDRMIWKTGIKL